MALSNGSFPLLVQLPSSSVGLTEGEVEGPAVGFKDGDAEGEGVGAGVVAGRVGARVGASVVLPQSSVGAVLDTPGIH